MGSFSKSRNLRIGVDVGGTNTDGVILDPTRTAEADRGIVAWHKAPTTSNPSLGITNAIKTMFEASKIDPAEVVSVTIGTTHFINAVVEKDARRLAKVAVLRLCGPFSKHAPPCVDWPADLRNLICGHYALLKGGLEVDGNLISPISEDEIRAECKTIQAKGITTVVVNGIFSPLDTVYQQEETAASIVRASLPVGADVVCSKDVANLGFLERENAAILNAAILPFARRTIAAFQTPIRALGLLCPVFIAQNDGTILPAHMAAKLPIRTFSSGPTNSMRGAAFLVQGEVKENVMVVDIGGTTTDVGLLLASGFPRQAAAYSDIAGVRMNFSCPDVRSIGLGGGSIVRKSPDGKLTVGPDSVGYSLPTRALIFGGSTATATDYSVAADPSLSIGNASLVASLSPEDITDFQATVKRTLERVIDSMKTSAEDLPVLLVGGGAILAPDELQGASRVLKPKWSGVANAIGAAVARVSGVVDTVEGTPAGRSIDDAVNGVKARAVQKAVDAGAKAESVEVVEIEMLPLQYVADKTRIIVRAAGDFDFSNTGKLSSPDELPAGEDAATDDSMTEFSKSTKTSSSPPPPQPSSIDITAYTPDVVGREWFISETDVDFIATGCYILGTGGGGSPYSSKLRLKSLLRQGAVVRVMNPWDLKDDSLVGCGGGAGSPTVGVEKLPGDEMMMSQIELQKLVGKPPDAMIALEIGGGNGLQGMILGASTNMDLPTVDGDWMGRAYPVKWQTTPVVLEPEGSLIWCPTVMCDGNGNTVAMTSAASDTHVERVFRAALSQLGSKVGCAEGYISGANAKRWVVEHTISQAWRIGRAVHTARVFGRIDSVADDIIEQVGGGGAARVLWKGKIVGVRRELRMGHVYGEVLIQSEEGEEGGEGSGEKRFQRTVKIPFKNENIACLKLEEGGNETTLAIVPDLITVIDAQDGEAIGTPEYRYGLQVVVLGIVATEKFTSTPRALKLGGPWGFGMEKEYIPLGTWVKPQSVIDEFGG